MTSRHLYAFIQGTRRKCQSILLHNKILIKDEAYIWRYDFILNLKYFYSPHFDFKIILKQNRKVIKKQNFLKTIFMSWCVCVWKNNNFKTKFN